MIHNYIKQANLPNECVSLVVVDGRLEGLLSDSFNKLGISVIWTKKHFDLYVEVSFHPDMFMCHVGGPDIVYAPGTDNDVLSNLNDLGFNLIKGSFNISSEYPKCAAYNVLIIGKYAFHKKNITDPVLLKVISKKNITMINVNQGYSKCSCCIVDEKAVITSDTGISSSCNAVGIDTLLIKPDINIKLPGLSYGFIGGCCGKIGDNKIAFTGNIKYLSQYKQIIDFINHKSVNIYTLKNIIPYDVGTIIPLLQIS